MDFLGGINQATLPAVVLDYHQKSGDYGRETSRIEGIRYYGYTVVMDGLISPTVVYTSCLVYDSHPKNDGTAERSKSWKSFTMDNRASRFVR